LVAIDFDFVVFRLLLHILCHSVLFPGIEDEQVLCLLKEVGLDDLLVRTGGLDCPLTWNWLVSFSSL